MEDQRWVYSTQTHK